MTTVAAPYSRIASPERSWWYLGCLVTPLATAADTGGALSIAECTIRAGVEPPAHVHSNEDEGFYVIDGAMRILLGEDWVDAPAGTFSWAPRHIPHSFAVVGESARVLVMTSPGGFLEQMFSPFSQPARTLTLPEMPDDVPFEAMLALDLRLGVEYPGVEA